MKYRRVLEWLIIVAIIILGLMAAYLAKGLQFPAFFLSIFSNILLIILIIVCLIIMIVLFRIYSRMGE